jgi:CTD small phosphatase-like protein 2
VLDLDETLIHFVHSQEENGDQEAEEAEDEEDNDFFYMVRPFCNKFLSELSKYYEIVIFTAAMQDYADWIVDGIDHRCNIKHRLYRQHCKREAPPQTEGEIEQGFQSVKDLRLLGRDIKKTIIIDNLRENFWSTCPDNGIEIESWYGDDLDDTEL